MPNQKCTLSLTVHLLFCMRHKKLMLMNADNSDISFYAVQVLRVSAFNHGEKNGTLSAYVAIPLLVVSWIEMY